MHKRNNGYSVICITPVSHRKEDYMANNGMISSYDFFKVLSNVVDDFLDTIPNLEEDWVWTVRVDSDGADGQAPL